MSDEPPVALSVPVVTLPTPAGPIAKLANSTLRDSINRVLAGIEPGHGHATIDIGDKGDAGIAIAVRLNDTGPVAWSVVVAARYNWHDRKPSYEAALDASW